MSYFGVAAGAWGPRRIIRKDTENPYLRNIILLGDRVFDNSDIIDPGDLTNRKIDYCGPYVVQNSGLIDRTGVSARNAFALRDHFEVIGAQSNFRRFNLFPPKYYSSLVATGVNAGSVAYTAHRTVWEIDHPDVIVTPPYGIKAAEGFDGRCPVGGNLASYPNSYAMIFWTVP